jgi:K+-transporting ATPase ATPase C chain
MILKQVRVAVVALVLFTVLTGLAYPLLITGIAQLVFPGQANGSLLKKDGRVMGSELIGQPFNSPSYFWSRLSATGPSAYNASASSGSNYGPLNPALFKGTKDRIALLQAAYSSNRQSIPVDLVTASSSGLDPHISIAAALYQAPRIARARSMTEESIRALIDRFTEPRGLGFLGEPGVNVLKLNLAMDAMSPSRKGGD